MARESHDRGDQINVVLTPEARAALDEIRASMRPIPSISEAVRMALVEKAEALQRKLRKAS